MPKYDVAIIGGGPGGYVAAIRAAQLGLKPAIIEADRIGGVCLNWGCIPSKALLWNAELVRLFRSSEEFGITYDALHIDMAKAVDRSRQVVDRMVKGVEFLLKKHKVAVVAGRGRLASAREVAVEGQDELIEAEHVIVATGARPRSLPGMETDGRTVIGSREALELRETPASAVVIGGGPVGVEFAYYWRAYGAEVTVVELLDHLLPLEDAEVSRQLERAFKQQGIAFRTGAKVNEVRSVGEEATVAISTAAGDEELQAEKVLVGVGVAANTDDLGLEELGVELERGFVKVDGAMRTNVAGVYAIGDVTGKLPLAHVASAQGVAAVEGIAGRETPPLDYERLPRCTYCQPQVASLGLTEAQARERGIEVKTGTFPYRGNGKALAIGRTEGLAKLVADARTGEVVGYHLIGHDATELLAEASLASTLESTHRELGWAVHAHPTLSEVVKEAALDIEREAIHFWKE
jgi:dihydrolipoamide dehydrogenase